MKLTEDSIWIDEDQEGGRPIVYSPNFSGWFDTKEEAEKLRQQILDDNKLRELIEKKIEELADYVKNDIGSEENILHNVVTKLELQQILVESKKSNSPNNFREIKILEDDE